ncbi:MAG: hypothetical protein VX231_01605 [Pseudomonadota bacterium]|nr:hypothetical protein [Pseudomonadota bacterium]
MRSLPSLLLPFKPLKVGVIFILLVFILVDRNIPVDYFIASKGKNFFVDCEALVGQLDSLQEIDQQKNISRFAPNEGRLTRLDNDPLPSPQVFKVLASFIEPSTQRVVTSHCQAVYTDRSKAFGNHVVEMPAHCFLSQPSHDQSVIAPNISSTLPSQLISPLNNYCVYMGKDIRQPEAIFSPTKIACKSKSLSSIDNLALDSCMVYLDRSVPTSIIDKPLVWWRPNGVPSKVKRFGSNRMSEDNTFLPVKGTAGQQLMVLLGANIDNTGYNVNSVNTEALADLKMISHSIDFDGFGGQRVVSLGKPFYQQSSERFFLSASHIPNTVDTRAGDSGAAVVIMQDEKKVLIGMQVAIMLSNSGEKKGSLDVFDKSDNSFQTGGAKLRHFNLAINPHLDESATYKHVFYAEARDPRLD